LRIGGDAAFAGFIAESHFDVGQCCLRVALQEVQPGSFEQQVDVVQAEAAVAGDFGAGLEGGAGLPEKILCATGFASASVGCSFVPVRHWRSQWHTIVIGECVLGFDQAGPAEDFLRVAGQRPVPRLDPQVGGRRRGNGTLDRQRREYEISQIHRPLVDENRLRGFGQVEKRHPPQRGTLTSTPGL